MPIFRVKSVKIYTGQKNLHGHRPRVRDKYEVWVLLIKNNYTHLLQISKCISNDKSYLWPLKLQLLGSAHTQMYLYFQSF